MAKSQRPRSVRGLIAGGTTIVCLALAFVLVYPVARDHYIATRTNDRLTAELVAVNARNAIIRAQIEELKTQEGIEDRAREEFGWVHQGETAVNITGLKTEESTTVMPASIRAGSIAADTEWINSVLDTLFNFDVNTTVSQAPDTNDLDLL